MMNSLEVLTAEREKAIADYMAYSLNRSYYDEQKDGEIQHLYYQNSSFERDSLSHLLEKTHQNKLFYSPHRYVYPWVDIHENKKLKSIYSGRGMDPLVAIEEDIQMLKNVASGKMTSRSTENALNCEHVVPQSWFDKQEPMKGDLHHLFACEPTCNSCRGNYPYYDFLDYAPESHTLGITEGCGKLKEGKFEPEYGKGIVARATMYFITRYPNIINRNYVNLQLLIAWHQQFPVSLYEKHRNLAIYELQGNRNPFIDFPHLAEILK